MEMPQQARRKIRRACLVFVSVAAFYVITVGAIPAMGRHMEDGRLQGMRGADTIAKVLEVYRWPARRMAGLPPMSALFEFSADCWLVITNAPETTG